MTIQLILLDYACATSTTNVVQWLATASATNTARTTTATSSIASTQHPEPPPLHFLVMDF
jgi:hypothetical protein